VSEFELKLMDINSENLGIPETEYSATVGGSMAGFLAGWLAGWVSVLGSWMCGRAGILAGCLAVLCVQFALWSTLANCC
jgi:hypothetical protein